MSIRVWAAAAAFATIMGFSRLAYGALVPAMRDALGGPLGLYGIVAGANFAGYLAGTFLATALARSRRRPLVNALALTAMSVAMAAGCAVHNALELGTLRFLVGVFSAVGLVLTLGLAVENVPPRRRGLAAAIVWSGGSLGIALVGIASSRFPFEGDAWRYAWVAMGLAGVLCAAAFLAVSYRATAADARADDGSPIGLYAPRYGALTLAYFAFGAGYIAALTFLGSALAHAHALALPEAWTVLGLCGIVAAAIWGPLVDRMRDGRPVALATGTCAFGALLCALPSAAAGLAGSIAIGISFLGVPAMTGALLQQREPPERYPRAFAGITVALGIGQVVGPVAGGSAADVAGAPAAMLVSAAMLALATLSALAFRGRRAAA